MLTQLRSYGPGGKTVYKFTFAEWAKRPEVSRAWDEIALKNDLALKRLPDPDAAFGFFDWVIFRGDPALKMR